MLLRFECCAVCLWLRSIWLGSLAVLQFLNDAAVVDLFQNHFGSVGVSKNGGTALLLLLGLAPVVVALRVLKRRQARRTGHTYVRFFGQSSWDTRSRVTGPPIEQKYPSLES